MLTDEHLVLCGGATAQQGGDAARLELNLHGTSANVRLEIGDISRRLVANISDVHADLLEGRKLHLRGRRRDPAWRKDRPATRRAMAEKASVRDPGPATKIMVV
jgi:hypothetical protein